MRPPVIALSRMRTVPVGESMPIDSGGKDVISAMQMPPAALPISIAQMATGMPALSWPGNIRAPNETMLAISTIEAMTPAVASETALREIVLKRDAAGASALAEAAIDCEADASPLVEAATDSRSRFGCPL